MSDEEIIQCKRGALNQMVQAERADAVRGALAPFKSKQQTGYFSTVRFGFIRSGAGPFTYTCPAGQRRVAFGYSQQETMNNAGFEPGKQANLRYTNLSQANKTRDGETYYIEGIALYRGATSDALLSAIVWDTVGMDLVMNTTDHWPLGALHFFPATAGLIGRGFTRLQQPPLDAEQTDLQLLANSVEDAQAYFSFKEPLIWNTSEKTNSSLSMEFQFPVDMVVDGVTARAAGPGIAGYTPPLSTADSFPIGTYVDITVRLVGHSISAVSENK